MRKVFYWLLCSSSMLFISCSKSKLVNFIEGETLEKIVKYTGREGSNESSDKIIRKTFDADLSEIILKRYDDDVVKRLSKDLADNPSLKELLISNKSALRIWELMEQSPVRNNPSIIKYFSEISEKLGESSFSNKYFFEVVGDVVVLKSRKEGNVLAEISETVVKAEPGKGGKLLNDFLDEKKLIPNMIYNVNGQKYIIGSDGNRYKEISGTLIHLPQVPPVRNVERQGLSKEVKDALPEILNGKPNLTKAGYPFSKDHGSHWLANMFGGGSEMYNYIPMSRKLNGSGGGWYMMEQKWAKALKEGKKVNYKIEPIYNGVTKRPDFFSVTYEIDGKRFTELFDNNVF